MMEVIPFISLTRLFLSLESVLQRFAEGLRLPRTEDILSVPRVRLDPEEERSLLVTLTTIPRPRRAGRHIDAEASVFRCDQ